MIKVQILYYAISFYYSATPIICKLKVRLQYDQMNTIKCSLYGVENVTSEKSHLHQRVCVYTI